DHMKNKGLVRSLVLGFALFAPAASVLATTLTTYCYVDEVRTFSNRVHVHCSFSGYTPYFAVPTSSSAEAGRFIQMATMAWDSSQPLFVEYDPYADASSFQCGYNDCRRALNVSLSV